MFLKISSRDTISSLSIVPIKINNDILICEFPKTQQDRETGLMYRNFLPMNHGMLFEAFGRYRPTFHMREVYIPLESIFVNNLNKIIDIVPMLPLDRSSIYTTTKNIPVKWVIEVNRNFCKNHKIDINDIVTIL